jgi:hypothetical protein
MGRSASRRCGRPAWCERHGRVVRVPGFLPSGFKGLIRGCVIPSLAERARGSWGRFGVFRVRARRSGMAGAEAGWVWRPGQRGGDRGAVVSGFTG